MLWLKSRTPDLANLNQEQKDLVASELVNKYSAWAAAAGVIPLPIVDVLAIGGLQLQMLRRLSEIYDVPFSDNIGKSLIASLAGSVLPASTATGAAVGVASLMKSIPAVGTTIASLTMPALSAASTYAIGKVFIQHFASGGTLLDFNPADYREYLRSQAEKARTNRGMTGETSTTPATTTRAPNSKAAAASQA